MSPETKATFLLYDKEFNPFTIPRVRYVRTKGGKEEVEKRLSLLLDSTVRKALAPPTSSPSSKTNKEFAADRWDEALRNKEPGEI